MPHYVRLTAFLLLFFQLGATAQRAAGADKDLPAEIERLKRIVSEAQQTVAECLERIEALEAKQKEREQPDRREDRVPNGKVEFFGDFRYRYETIRQDRDDPLLRGVRGALGAPSDVRRRERHQIRLRLGAEYVINPEVKVVARLTTAMDGTPVSGNQTLTGGFSRKDVWFDQAYFDYQPGRAPGLQVLGGKTFNPYFKPGDTQLIWDSDIMPEGLAVNYVYSNLDRWELTGVAGYFQVEERIFDRDARLWGFQGRAKYRFIEDGRASVAGGVSYYDYVGAQGYPPFFFRDSHRGNSLSLAVLNGLGLYANDYDLLELFLELEYPIGNLPLKLYGDYVVNLAADDRYFDTGRADTGWAAGVKLGRLDNPRSWRVGYEYRVLERDAVVGAFTDSSFGGGGTNSRGHVMRAEFMLMENVRLNATYYDTRSLGSDFIRLIPVWGEAEKIDGKHRRLQLNFYFTF